MIRFVPFLGLAGVQVVLMTVFKAWPSVVLWPLLMTHLLLLGLGPAWHWVCLRTGVFCFWLVALWSYGIEGVVFGPGFFVHAQPNTVFFMGFFPTQAWSTLVGVFAHCGIEGLLRLQGNRTQLSRLKQAALFVMAFTGLALSPAQDLVVHGLQPKAPTSSLPNLSAAWEDLKRRGIEEADLFPDLKKLNLNTRTSVLLFYLESLEASYFDETKFPGLLPFLTQKRKTALVFPNFKQSLGNFTVNGLFASQCGYPFEIFSREENMNDTLFYDGTRHLTCLGDVFAQMGHRRIFFQGTSLDFAGVRNLFRDHQFDEVVGSAALTGSSAPYAVAKDQQLYDAVGERLLRLARENRPYLMASINFGTHDPGHPDDSCVPYGDGRDPQLNAVHCLDGHLKKLFEKLSSTNALANTAVVFMSDHLSRLQFKEEPNRRNFLMISPPSHRVGKIMPQEIYHHDFPKILADVLKLQDGPTYPLAFSPLSQKKRTHALEPPLLKSLARIFQNRQQDALACDTEVTFHHKKNRLDYGQRHVYFSPGQGILAWPRDRIAAVAVGKDGSVLFKELLYVEEVMLRLTQTNIHRVLLWGHLDQVAAFSAQAPTYGYFWGELDAPKVIQPLEIEGEHTVRLSCPQNR